MRAHYVLLDNECALAAAAEAARHLGFITEIASEVSEQPVASGCSMLLSKLLELSSCAGAALRGACLISGGEFACPVKGPGVGGRNLETTLRCAIEMDERYADARERARLPSQIVALSAGTDGVDGNSPAAGALAERTTLARARSLGLDARRFLSASDAYSFFDALGDCVVTGPTGTNVRDLRVLVAV